MAAMMMEEVGDGVNGQSENEAIHVMQQKQPVQQLIGSPVRLISSEQELWSGKRFKLQL
eukprot:m.196739 g.196739  ORF g.196739 m.196739 type:complete len:59 (+) comp14909_c1_seq16:6071-6247(+)